jgi:hypothetical protein
MVFLQSFAYLLAEASFLASRLRPGIAVEVGRARRSGGKDIARRGLRGSGLIPREVPEKAEAWWAASTPTLPRLYQADHRASAKRQKLCT